MWATERSAEVARRIKAMGLFDRWQEVEFDQFEGLTGIACGELGGGRSEIPQPRDWSMRDFGNRFFPDEQTDL